MKKVTQWSLLWFTIVSIVLVLFVAFNESYTFKDANNAFLQWNDNIKDMWHGDHFRQQNIPLGIASLETRNLVEKISVGGWGPSESGRTLAVYITPDILPFIWGISLIMVITMVTAVGVAWISEILATKIADIYRRRPTRAAD